MKNQTFICIIIAVLILAPFAGATPIIKTEIIKSQYGNILANQGYGGVLYQDTYSDNTIGMRYVEGKNLPLFSVTWGIAQTITVSTSGSSSTWYCNSIIATGSDGSSGSSYGCGSARVGAYTSFEAFSNSMTEMAKANYGYKSGRDTVILNGITYNSPTGTGTADPKPTATPTPSPTPTPGPGVPTTTTPLLANLIAAILAWLKTLGA